MCCPCEQARASTLSIEWSWCNLPCDGISQSAQDWLQKYTDSEAAIKRLAVNDIELTNQKDKPEQLAYLKKMDAKVTKEANELG